jgi:hypothetical protein
MPVLTKARNFETSRRGRHAIERARSAVDASRLRHAHLTLPRGVHRTRMSEARPHRGGAAVRHVPAAPRTPFLNTERILAMRLPGSAG